MSSVRWHSIRQRMQALMDELSRCRRVLFVEPPAVVDVGLFHAGMRTHLGQALRGRREIGNLHIFTPVLPSLTQTEPMRVMCQRIMRLQVERAARGLGLRSPVVWTYFYPGLSVQAIPRGDVAYDCVDDPALHAMFAGRRTRSRKAMGEERLIARRAKWVFATARLLAARLMTVNPSVHLLPNAAEPGAFAPRATQPDDLRGIPRPIAGYVGSVAPWIDFDLLDEVSRLLPRVSFVLVGPILLGAEISHLRARPNVHFLGPKPHPAVPSYMQAFDVCLIPFLLNDITMSVNPIKFFEYLAAGKPVVATPLPELEPFGPVADLRSGAASFARAIEASAANPEAGRAERLRVAGGNTWRHRVEEMLRVIERTP